MTELGAFWIGLALGWAAATASIFLGYALTTRRRY